MQSTHWGVLPISSGQPMEYERLFVDLGYKKQLHPRWLSQWNLTYNHATHNLNAPTSTVPTLQHLSEDNLLFEQTHFFNFFDNDLTFSLGGLVEWQTGKMTQETLFDPVSPYSYLKSSVYGEMNYAILKNLKLSVGGQWNRFEGIGKNNGLTADKATTGQVGRLGLVYEINSNLGMKLLYNQAFRTPSALELNINVPAAIIGNANLQAERIETIDAQVFYHSHDYKISLTAFRSRQSNLVTRVLLPAPQTGATFVNGGSGIFQGLELETSAKLFDKLNWTGAYTFQTNRDGDGKNNLSLTPNHIAKMGLSYEVLPELQLSIFDTFFSHAKKYPAATQVNPAAGNYHYLTMNGNYRLDSLLGSHFAKHVTFSMYLDNVLNAQVYYPEFNRKKINTISTAAGRSLYGEIAIEF